ncbi:hypothetical protein F442_00095 [Phytophthora nicotianae P10297]|uniref:Secreted protein n=5 Tax=Phytophthora nicotianae TaxID=4792 RepID=W3A9X0_PHYNI|nr:hypothetical protein F444_00103 [Phytophthora nicotianae P1976]ETP55309.1 hypothetical protein F442_00095 [Phytophthora nicotianae P10297]
MLKFSTVGASLWWLALILAVHILRELSKLPACCSWRTPWWACFHRDCSITSIDSAKPVGTTVALHWRYCMRPSNPRYLAETFFVGANVHFRICSFGVTSDSPFTVTVMTTSVKIPTTSNASSTRTTGRTTVGASHRVRLCYHDEAYRQRTEERTKNLIADASLPTTSSTSALLAKKALKYRKLYDRMTGVDVNDPNFDVFEFLGVDWCKASPVGTSGHA